MPAISIVLYQHSEGASFLWDLRRRAVDAPHYNLADLAKLDERVDAHLDGLRIAGEAGWEICNEALLASLSCEVFTRSVLAFEGGNTERMQTVLETGTASAELSRGLVSALGWLTWLQAEPHIRELFGSSSPRLQRVGISASAIHRWNPGSLLPAAIAHTDSALRARALRAAGEIGVADYFSEVRNHLADSDNACRFWAAWAASLLSADSQPLAILQPIAESSLPYSEKAMQLAIRRMDTSSASAWNFKLAEDPKRIRTAITAAGAFGDPARTSWLIEQMRVPNLARLAGEAFTMITGVDIAFEDLDADKPEGFEAGPTENSEDEDVEMDPDENLPWPDPDLIAEWWRQHRANFQNGTRYLLGKPISVDWCQEVLRKGRQRQRAAAALELAIRQPGQPLFNVAAPGFRQQQMLGIRK